MPEEELPVVEVVADIEGSIKSINIPSEAKRGTNISCKVTTVGDPEIRTGQEVKVSAFGKTYTQKKELPPGGSTTFDFTISIPSNIALGSHTITVSLTGYLPWDPSVRRALDSRSLKTNIWDARRPPCERAEGGYGDVDRDGWVTIADRERVRDIIMRIETREEGIYDPLADVDGDMKITEKDLSLIDRYIFGEIDTFPVCTPKGDIIVEHCKVPEKVGLGETATFEVAVRNIGKAKTTFFVKLRMVHESGEPEYRADGSKVTLLPGKEGKSIVKLKIPERAKLGKYKVRVAPYV